MIEIPKRIQMSRQHPWRKDNPDAVIVSRPSKWGNPFTIGTRVLYSHFPGDAPLIVVESGSDGPRGTFDIWTVPDWQTAVDTFEAWMTAERGHGLAVPNLEPLRGHDLACWCPLDQPCHADVLLELANPTSDTRSTP